MHATPSVFRMISALLLSFSETPSRPIYRCYLISVLSSRPSPSSLLVTVQFSDPYISTGLIVVLLTFPLRLFDILASHKTPLKSLHFCQAALILLIESCS